MTPVASTGRQSLQRGKPQRQLRAEGNPPSGLAPQRAGSETPARRWLPNALCPLQPIP